MICYVIDFLFGTTANGEIDRTAFWTAIAALAAFVAVFVAWYELGETRKTARADFAKRFVDSFFTKETRELYTLLMNSALEFDVLEIKNVKGKKIDELPFFKIKKDIANQLNGVVNVDSDKTGYSAFEMDDLLLGLFEDIGWYEKRKLIDLETISEMFGYHISECFNHREIQKYLQKEYKKGNFKNFRRLAELIEAMPIPSTISSV